MATGEERLFCKIALKYDLLTREQIRRAIKLRKRSGRELPLVAVLIEEGYLDDERLDRILSLQQKNLQALLDRGSQYKAKREFRNAIRDFSKALRINPQ
ncbi:MAG: hypothetical protein HY720_30695, partial [Planctomycetes bacterium]|nr:hypothetical protein [Planctomycetota bacterium]